MKPLAFAFAFAFAFSFAFASSSAFADEPRPSPKSLAQLNSLTQTLAGTQTVATEEVERLFEQAEVIAFRDATRGTTPQAVTYAASTERAMNAYSLKGAGPARVLTELALTLGAYDGPQSAGLVERFRLMLLSTFEIKPSEARPMPELPAQLAEVAQWAGRTVDKMAALLPADEGTLDRLRMLVARGRYADAAAMAAKHSELGARALGWLAAALILKGDLKEAAAPAAAALQAGGEPAATVRGARLRRARLLLAEKLGDKPFAHCHQILTNPAGAGGPKQLEDLILACSALLWEDPDRSWLARAAQLLPSGAAGAPVRAAADLQILFSAQRPDSLGRAQLIDHFRKELQLMSGSADERRALWLLGNVAAAEQPMVWVPTTEEEQKEILALDRGSPCDAATFALRTLAVRGNPPELGAFAASVVNRCLSMPGGVQVAADAIGMLLTMAHDADGPVRPEVVEKLALALAQAHPTDPLAVGAHADAVAARALSHVAAGATKADGAAKASLPALEAALARYEDAIHHATPAGGPAVRARLDQNAGFLSLALATRMSGKQRAPFLMRAQRHLRFALALDDNPAGLGTRARFDTVTGMRMGTQPSLDKLPPSATRSRAACLLAVQAARAGQSAASRHYLDLARSGEHTTLDAEELMISPQALFNVTLDEGGLHPAAEMHASLWLVPACSPADVSSSLATPSTKKSEPTRSPTKARPTAGK